MPKMSRPELMWSTVRAMSASSCGLRYELQVTSAPISIREVIAAQAASVVQHSKWAPSRSPYSGKKWSQCFGECRDDESRPGTGDPTRDPRGRKQVGVEPRYRTRLVA